MPRAREFFAPADEKRREIFADRDDGFRVPRNHFRAGRARAFLAFAHIPCPVDRDANTNSKTEADSKANPSSYAEAHSETDAGSNAEADTSSNSDANTNSNSDANTGSHSEAHAGSHSEANSKTDASSNAETHTDTETFSTVAGTRSVRDTEVSCLERGIFAQRPEPKTGARGRATQTGSAQHARGTRT
ncbi:MAG: hypothetical protein ACXWFY_07475 [Chthoniobacterales bacterium]